MLPAGNSSIKIIEIDFLYPDFYIFARFLYDNILNILLNYKQYKLLFKGILFYPLITT